MKLTSISYRCYNFLLLLRTNPDRKLLLLKILSLGIFFLKQCEVIKSTWCYFGVYKWKITDVMKATQKELTDSPVSTINIEDVHVINFLTLAISRHHINLSSYCGTEMVVTSPRHWWSCRPSVGVQVHGVDLISTTMTAFGEKDVSFCLLCLFAYAEGRYIQGWTIRTFLVCENAAGKLRQKWQATADAKFTIPENGLIVQPCTWCSQSFGTF